MRREDWIRNLKEGDLVITTPVIDRVKHIPLKEGELGCIVENQTHHHLTIKFTVGTYPLYTDEFRPLTDLEQIQYAAMGRIE